MERTIGTTIRGIRCPIIREGDNLAQIVVDSILNAKEEANINFNDRDIVAVTESVVARAQGNYVSVDDIAEDIQKKFNCEHLGLIFPITSRNRFSLILKGIARGVKKITLLLNYPSDEVGNALLSLEQVEEAGINPYSDVLTLKEYRNKFGENKHQFTGVDYVSYYQEIIEKEDCEAEIIFGNNATTILNYTNTILCCDIYGRFRNKKKLLEKGAKQVLTLDEILNEKSANHGYNEQYGLLGSNKASEESLKLFPYDCQSFVEEVQQLLNQKTNKKIEVMVYGDGAFKDPVGKIWELADPVVSPAYTSGLEGTPNELKIKFLADNDYKDLHGNELKAAINERIQNKEKNLVGQMVSEGTTPRRLTDLIGSLCDLTSGSGDKGTPIILIQGYFDNYSN